MINSNILYKIKHEFIHKERLTTEIIKDAEASIYILKYLIGGKTVHKESYDIKLSDVDGNEEITSPSSLHTPNLGINGYMHYLMNNPFGFLLISEIQVKN